MFSPWASQSTVTVKLHATHQSSNRVFFHRWSCDSTLKSDVHNPKETLAGLHWWISHTTQSVRLRPSRSSQGQAKVASSSQEQRNSKEQFHSWSYVPLRWGRSPTKLEPLFTNEDVSNLHRDTRQSPLECFLTFFFLSKGFNTLWCHTFLGSAGRLVCCSVH